MARRNAMRSTAACRGRVKGPSGYFFSWRAGSTSRRYVSAKVVRSSAVNGDRVAQTWVRLGPWRRPLDSLLASSWAAVTSALAQVGSAVAALVPHSAPRPVVGCEFSKSRCWLRRPHCTMVSVAVRRAETPASRPEVYEPPRQGRQIHYRSGAPRARPGW